jgi:2-iminobutanoate/2-iminopropanoate deaminase
MSEVIRQNHMSARVYETRRGEERAIFPHAILVDGGRVLYVSGQLAVDGQGNLVGEGDMRAQYVQVAENLKAVLEDAGASLKNVVKMNTFITDMDAHMECIDLRQKYFGEPWPTSTTVEVSKLAVPGTMIEIELVAMV